MRPITNLKWHFVYGEIALYKCTQSTKVTIYSNKRTT